MLDPTNARENHMIDSTCTACGRAGGDLRPLPRPDDSTRLRFSTGLVCETCTAPAVEALRDVIRRAECADSDDCDEVDRMSRLVAFLELRGLDMSEMDAGGLAAAGVRRRLHAFLDSLERQLICSQCWSRGPESRMHVVPTFASNAGRYVTSFRCEDCVDGALAQSIARVRDVDGASEIDTLGDLLRSHGVLVHEWLRGESLDRLRPVLMDVLASLRGPAVRLRLRIGSTAPMPAPRRTRGG